MQRCAHFNLNSRSSVLQISNSVAENIKGDYDMQIYYRASLSESYNTLYRSDVSYTSAVCLNFTHSLWCAFEYPALR